MKKIFSLVLFCALLIIGCDSPTSSSSSDDSSDSYTVTYDSQGATSAASPSTATVTSPDTHVSSLPTAPSKTGYGFGGWYTETNGGGSQFSDSTTVSSDITVYAYWVADAHTVTFDSQSATVEASPTTKIVVSPATTVDSLPTAPSKTGYTFGGWFTVTNGGGTEFTTGTTVSSDITVYAKWTAITYAVGDTGPSGVGIVFYTSDGGAHGLEAAPSDQGDIKWAEAMSVCDGLNLNGFTDWYLPSLDELVTLYDNRTDGYGFVNDDYWSSTENEALTTEAWVKGFTNGGTAPIPKVLNRRVRAIRSF